MTSWSLYSCHVVYETRLLHTSILEFISGTRTPGIVTHPFPHLWDNKRALYAPIGSIAGNCMTNRTLSKTNINTVNIPVSWTLLIALHPEWDCTWHRWGYIEFNNASHQLNKDVKLSVLNNMNMILCSWRFPLTFHETWEGEESKSCFQTPMISITFFRGTGYTQDAQ